MSGLRFMVRAREALGFIAAAAMLLTGRESVAQSICGVGAYRGSDGDFVIIVERPDPSSFRYYFRDGRFGSPGDHTVTCTEGAVIVRRDGASEHWPAIALTSTASRFRSGDANLQGLLIEPPGSEPARPLVVLVHGSENTASIQRNPYPYIFAAQGISAFVFDKRGTGGSEGVYNQNFHRLAADVVAASAEAKRIARGRFGRFGLFGGSQGGWVAPRAANESGADFVAIGFGLLIDPLQEDAEQVASELRALGYDQATLAKARRVTDATGELMASDFKAGYEEVAELRRRHGAEPWFERMRGEFTGDILRLDEATLRREGQARFNNLDIDWRYDAVAHVRVVRSPQLWVIAAADREAPPAETIARLQRLRAEKRPIEVAIFPRTDHGMVEFETMSDGSRRVTRIANGYFQLLGDWILGRKRPPYGAATFLDERGSAPSGG